MALETVIIHSTAKDELRLRSAALTDVDGITELAIEAFPDDPERDYRFPYRAQFPDDHWKWTKCEYENYLLRPDKFYCEVVEARTRSTNTAKIVAFCAWDIAHLTGCREESSSSILGEHERKDANLTHMRYFALTLKKICIDYFDQFNTEQIHLANLCTHRDYRRRGCGAALCRWGMKTAEEKGWVVTVLGSPLGKLLYKSVGFRQLGVEPMQVPGEDEKLAVATLVYDSFKSQ